MSDPERGYADSDSTASLVQYSFDEHKCYEAYGQLKYVSTSDEVNSLGSLQDEMPSIIPEDAALSPVLEVIPTTRINIHERWKLKTNPSSSSMEATEEEEASQSLLEKIISKKMSKNILQSSEGTKDFAAVDEGVIIKPPSDEKVVIQQEMDPDYENSQISLIDGNLVSGFHPLALDPSENTAAEDENQIMLQDGDISAKTYSHYPFNIPPSKVTFGLCMPADDLSAVSISSENVPNTLSSDCNRSDALSIVDILSNKASVVLGSSESTPSDLAARPSRREETAIAQNDGKNSSVTAVEPPNKLTNTLNMCAVDCEIAAPALSPGVIRKKGKILFLEDLTRTNMQRKKYKDNLRSYAKHEEVTDGCIEDSGNMNAAKRTSCSKMTPRPSCQQDSVADASNTSCPLDTLCSQNTARQMSERNAESLSIDLQIEPINCSNYDFQTQPEVRKSSRLARKWQDGSPSNFWWEVQKIEPDNYVKACNIKGQTKLHLAAKKGYLSSVKSLIQRGSDVNAPDYFAWTPLHEASTNGFLEVVEELLRAGAKVNCRGLDDITPLHSAARCGQWKVAQCLLQNGADPQLKNAHGFTAVDVCKDVSVKPLLNTWAQSQPADGDQARPLADEPAPRPVGDAGREPATRLTESSCPDGGSAPAGVAVVETVRPSSDLAPKDPCPEKKKIQRKPGRKKGRGASNDKQRSLVKVYEEAIKELDGIEITLQSLKSWDLSLTGNADKYKQALQKMQLILNTLFLRQKEDSQYLSSLKNKSSLSQAKVNNELWHLLMVRRKKFMELLTTHNELGSRCKTFQQKLNLQSQIQQHQTSEIGNSQATSTPSAEEITMQSSEVAQVPTGIEQPGEQQTMAPSVVIPCVSQNTSRPPTENFVMQMEVTALAQDGNYHFDCEEVVCITDASISVTQPSGGNNSLDAREPRHGQMEIPANGPSAPTLDEDAPRVSAVVPRDAPRILHVTTRPMDAHSYSQPCGQQTGNVPLQETGIKVAAQAAPGEVMTQPTASQADTTGGVPLFLSYRQLIRRGVLQPGKDILSIHLKDTVRYASLMTNGAILTQQLIVYNTPMLWHQALLARASCPSWSVTASVVSYKGIKMSSYATRTNYRTTPLRVPNVALPVCTAPTANVTAPLQYPAQEAAISSDAQSATRPSDVPITKHFILTSPDSDLTGYEGCSIFRMPKKVQLVQNSELLPMYYINDLFNNPDNWDFLCSEGTK